MIFDKVKFSIYTFFSVHFFTHTQDVFTCSCGDTPYSIPRARALETFEQGAFWCSGTLNMIGYDQNPIVIFNTLSYAQLQEGLQGLDEYLECVSTGGTGFGQRNNPNPSTSCESIRPGIPELERQGVSSIAVLTR